MHAAHLSLHTETLQIYLGDTQDLHNKINPNIVPYLNI